MSKDFGVPDSGKKYMIFVKAVILGVAATALCVVIFSGIMLLLELNRAFAAPLATVSIATGTLLAAFYAARSIGDRGYLVGLIVGIITFAIVTVVSLIISDDGLSYNTLFHFIIILLSSLIGGIIGVNKRKNTKFI